MRTICIFLLYFFFAAYAHRVPHGTEENLNWEEGGSYIATGISVNRIVEYGEPLVPYTYNRTAFILSESDATLVVDVVNRRMFLDMGEGGQYYYNETGGLIILGGVCGRVPFTYSTQVREYATPILIGTVYDEDVGWMRLFNGENKDIGSCYETIGVTMGQNEEGEIVKWGFSHPWFLRTPSGKFTRSLISGYISLPRTEKFRGGAPDRYFRPPAACNTPLPYCAPGIFFPQRNVTYPNNDVV